MLHLWFCTDRKYNTARMLRALCERASAGERRLILLEPEQFSHSAERRLCEMGGDTISRSAEVLSFSRLADRVFSRVGGLAEVETDNGGKLLLMSLAIEQIRPKLKMFGNTGSKPEFLLKLLDAVDEFHSFCITPNALRHISEKLSGALAVKTEELALIMESYDAACANVGQNPQTRLTRLCEILRESDILDDCCFFLDGFTDFNGVEQEILCLLMQRGAELNVNLFCDGPDSTAQQYAAARDTAAKLLRGAAQSEIKSRVHLLPAEQDDSAIGFLRRHLFGGRRTQFAGGQEQVSLILTPDVSTECRAVAGEILRLIEEGARWRDVTVACADYAAYRAALRSVFRRAEIPAYFAGDSDILHQPVVHALLDALEAATGGMEQESVLSYLKSGFSGISEDRCDRLENYVLLWGVRGSRWEKPWTMNPYGYRREADDHAQELLEALNADRKTAVMPLLRLRDSLRTAATTGEMVLALNTFMETIGLNERLNAMAEEAYAKGELQLAQEYAQVYAIICGLMEQLYGILGASQRSAEEFYRVLRTALSRYSVGTIPASLDCVGVGSILSQRQCDSKYLFVLGANEGALPSVQSSQSVLTDQERERLIALGVSLMPTAAGRLERELAAINSVLNTPTEHLWLSATEGSESYYLRRAAVLLPDMAVLRDASGLTERSERDYLDYLVGVPERQNAPDAMAQKAARLSEGYAVGTLSPEAVEALYRRPLRLSSTQIDTLAACRFCYFLRYGLRAEERKTAEMDPSLYGTFVHDVLEHTARQVQREGGFKAVSHERVLRIAQARMEEYAQTKLADLWESARAEYLFRRSFSEVRQVVTELYRELSRSEFEPKWFELHFARDGVLPAVTIAGEKMTALLEGYVDRADVWHRGDRVYVRIVDYKTGPKSFEYHKILSGLGLQMLLYLFALARSGGVLGEGELLPAGVLYFPARVERVTIPDKLDQAALEKKRRKNLQRSGLLLDEEPVLQAMEPCEGEPEFLPYGYDRSGERTGDLASAEQLDALEKYVFRTVAALGDGVYEGKLAPNPYFCGDRSNACLYCPFSGVCRGEREERWLASIKDPAEFWKAVEEGGTRCG